VCGCTVLVLGVVEEVRFELRVGQLAVFDLLPGAAGEDDLLELSADCCEVYFCFLTKRGVLLLAGKVCSPVSEGSDSSIFGAGRLRSVFRVGCKFGRCGVVCVGIILRPACVCSGRLRRVGPRLC
jgi:hypothetical protein